jgi:uncharacterized membrane protein
MALFSEKNYRAVFHVGLIIKAIDGAIEVILGALLYFLSSVTANALILALTRDELTEQPRDAIWQFIAPNFHNLTPESQLFWAFLLLGHGVVKVFLVTGLLKDKLWAYPVAAVAFGGFVMYQIYDLMYHPSLFITILTLFDIALIFLTLHEYRFRLASAK